MRKSPRPPWVMRLPAGLREQPAWIFIGTLSLLTGLSYLLGLAGSSTINQVLAPTWLRLWGGILCLSGMLVVVSTIRASRALERLALRFLSLCLLVYMGWVLTAVSLSRAALTVMLCVSLVGLSEIRVAVVRALLQPLPPSLDEEVDQWDQ